MALVGAAMLLGLTPPLPAAASNNASINLTQTLGAPTMTPALQLSLSVDKGTAIPGDTLTYSSTITNSAATLAFSGTDMAQNNGNIAATVSAYYDDVEYYSMASKSWVALAGAAASATGYTPLVTPPIATGMTFSATPVAATGVTYPSSGNFIVGTQINTTATAAWNFQASVTVTPSQIAILKDPSKVNGLRDVVHFEVTPRATTQGQPFNYRNDVTNLFQSQSAAVSNVTITINQPSGGPAQFTGSTTPGLASLAPGASVSVTSAYQVPRVAAKGASESDSDYLARLTALNGSSMQAMATASGSGPNGTVQAPAPAPVSTREQLPIVTIAKSGPATTDAGTSEANPLTLQNAGLATASSLAITDSLPGGANGNVSGTPATLQAGASGSAQALFPIPAAQPDGSLTDTAAVTWQDANGNGYGPLSSSWTTQVHSTLAGATLTLAPASAGPDVTGTSQTLQATLVDRTGKPITNQAIGFAVTGANPTSGSTTTDANGVAPFTYTGNNNGIDQVQATVSSGSVTLQSNTSAVNWVTPITTVSTTSVTGRFYYGGCGSFCANVANPVFTQTFPTIDFNPPAGTVPNNITNVGVETRPFTDITTNALGVFTGSVVAQGNGHQAGSGDLFGFDAVFTGTYVVAKAGDISFSFYSDDGFIFGVGNGASRVSGAYSNPPSSTPLQAYPVMGAYNQPTSPVANQVTVHFPTAGSFPYEVDYSECCGGQVSLTMASSATGHGVPPAGNLTITPVNVPTQAVGQPVKLTVAAMDASGQAVASLPLTMTVSGPNSQLVTGTTDASGTAVLSYTGTATGTDLVIVGASVSGAPAVSNTIPVTWAFGSGSSATQPPPVIVNPSPADGTVVTKRSALSSLHRPARRSPRGRSATRSLTPCRR